MRTVITLLLVAPVSAFAADVPADFKLTAEAFAKEQRADRKAFGAKYNGKTVELTATVRTTAVPNLQVLLNGYKEKPTDTGNPVYCNVPAKLSDQLRGLARGQQVTVRGKFPKGGTLPALDDCEFVKIGSSTALPVTLAALDAEFKKTKVAAEKKYENRSVVVRVTVLDAKTDSSKIVWTVRDPAGKGAVKVQAWADPLLDKTFQAELEKVKAGDTVILIGDAEASGDSVRLWGCVVLKEPPAGVKLSPTK